MFTLLKRTLFSLAETCRGRILFLQTKNINYHKTTQTGKVRAMPHPQQNRSCWPAGSEPENRLKRTLQMSCLIIISYPQFQRLHLKCKYQFSWLTNKSELVYALDYEFFV